MNKIYRVVWNETTQTWNAVAEFAKAHGKTASSGIGGIVASVGVRFAFTAIMSGLLLASGQAVATVENNGKTLANGTVLSAAADGTDYNTCYFDTVSYNVVCGDDTTKALDFIPQTGGQPPKQGKSVAIGQGAQTSGESNVAIGPKTVTANTGSIAIGVAASANHNQSIAMGQEASAKGEADVSIGKLAGDTVSSDGRNISIGESALKGGSGVNNVIAIGSSAGINSNSSHSVYIGTGATGMDPKNISIGYQANTKSGSIAVGDNSNAQGSSSVAIGTKSVVTDVASNGVAIGFNSTTSGLSAVAIGGSSSTGKGANASGPASLAIMGTAVASAPRAISIGEFTVGSGAYGIAIGGKANAQGTSSIAIGGSQAQDKGATAAGHFSTAIGYGAKTVNQDTTAVGKNSTANGLRATAFGVDSNAGAENALAVGPQTAASAKGAIAVGFATQATGMSSVAVGKEAIATKETSTSLGQNSQATANNAVAIGNKAVAAGTGNIVVGTNAGVYDAAVSAGRTVGADTVYIGADSGRNAYTNERQISIGKGTGNNATGVDNIALGLRSGAFVSGANNVAIGREAGMGTDAQKLSVTSTVAIGEAAKGSFSNTVAIGKTALAEKESAVAVGMVSKASGDNSVAIGKTANASAHETVAIGHETVAGAVSSVAVGQRANASGSEAVALGIDSNASGKFAVAIGNMAKVTDSKLNGIAIGSNAVASEDYAMAMGLDTQATGNSSIAFGNTAKALGKEAVAFGHLATAAKNNTLAFGVSSNSAEVGAVTLGAYTKADAVTGTALGYSAHAVNENDVALGGNSLTEAHHNGDYTLNGNYTAAGTSSYGTVSVGSINTAEAGKSSNAFTRQIQNVSAGVISATSTDAINGSQLYTTNSYLLNLGNNVKNALGGETAIDNAGNLTLNNLGGTGKANVHDALEAMNNKIDQLGGGSSSHFYSVQTASNARGNYNNDGATGLDALAAGADAQAAGDFAVAVGTGAQAVISNSIAIGKNASVNEDTASVAAVNGATKGEGSVAIGANTKASGTNATAVGQASNAYGQNSFAGGQSSKALGKSSVAVGDGAIANQDSSTAIGAYSQSTAAGATALGFNTRATASGTVAAGRNSKATSNNALALGNEADAQKDDTIAIGYNAQATQNRAVAFGKNAKATAGDTFAFGDSAKASTTNAIAFGKNANAAHAGSIALGANSATEAAVQTTSAAVGGLTFGNFAGNTPESTLSIGSAGKERTITNVAAGRISNNSTDAVNGSQLYATQNVMNNIGTTAVGVLGGNAAIANDGTITMSNIGGTGASTIEGAISAINNASYKSFKLNTAKTSGTNGEAYNHSLKEITNGSTITLEAGKNIVLNQNESTVSINTADAPEFAGKITAKGGLDMSNTKITNLGKGDQPTDAVNLSQLTDAINNVHVTTLTAVTNEAPFAYVSEDGKILKRNVTVDGSGAKQVSFVYADDTSTPYNGAVTIAALNPTDPQTTVPTQVGNVAAGKGQNDAVNVSQLDKVAQALGTSVNNATGEIAAPKYSVISGSPATSGVADYNNVGDALTALSNAVRAPLTFAGDSGTPSTRQLGSTVAVKGGEADATKLSDSNNIGVVSDDANGTLNVKLAKELKGLTSSEFVDAAGGKTIVSADGITVGTAANPVKLTTEGLSNGGKKATDIAAGVNNTDAVNVSQLTPLATALGATVNPTTGAVEVPNLVVTKTDGTQAAPVNTVQGALDNIGTELQKGLTFGGDNADKNFERKLGNQVLVKGGADAAKLSDNNIGVVSDDANGTLNVKLAKELQGLNSAQFETDGNVTTINGGNVSLADKDGNIAETTANGITLTPVPSSGKEAVSLTKDGLNNGGNKITKVAEGMLAADSTDAVNGAQLYKVDQKANTNAENIAKGINIGGTSGSNKYALGDTVNIKGDSNIVSETVEGGVQLKLADTVKIGQDSGKPVSIDGVNGTVSGLSNKALGGADFATKGQAATEEQLNETQANLAKILGGNAANNNGNVTFTDIGGTGKANVHDAIAAVKETAEKGWNLNANDETSSEKIAAGDTVTFKEGKNVKVSRDGKNITVATSDDVSFNKVTVGDSVLTDNGLTVGNGAAGNPVSLTKDGLNNGGNKISNVAAGEADTDAVNVAQLKANSGRVESGNDNIVVETDKTGTSNVYKVSTAKNLKADSLTAGETVVNNSGVTVGDKVTLSKDGLKAGDVNITADGIDAGNKAISNVAKGVKATDAVNVAQLNEQLAATEKTTTVVAGKNVTVSEKVDGNNTEYTVNADKTTLSQAAGGAVKVSEGTKDADGVTDYALDLTDEAKADIAKGVAAKDAVDNKGLTFAADNGTTGAKKLGDSLSVKGDGNILTRADENGIGFSLADKITVGKAGNGNKPLVIDGTAGLISGLSNTTLGGADFATKGQAASEEQLNAAQANLAKILGGNAANNKGNVTTTDIGGTGKDNVHDAIAAVKETADKGWNLNANDETSSEKIGAGDTVTFKEGKNVKVSRNGKNITVATSDDVSFDKVTVGGSVLTDNGLTVGNGKAGKPVSLTKDGLNNGGNKVSDIAAGEDDTDAVNVAQLKAAAAKATSKVDSGNDNIVVTPEQNADGSTTYKVATTPNLKANSFTAGDTVMNNDGVKVGDKVALGKDGLKAGDVNITTDGINAGNKAISNVAEGKKDTDAVNVAQLKAAAAKATSKVDSGNDNIVVTPEQNADGSTTYKVATAPDLKADSLTTGDTVVNNDGVKVGDKVALGKDGLKAGDVNITADGINAGNKAISNVAEGKKDTDAVNVGQLNRLTAAAKTEVEAGTNIASVSSKQGANKQTVYTINADGASVSAGSDKIVVTKGKKDANNVTDYAVDLSKAVKADIAKGVAAKDAVDNKGISFAGDSGTTVANKLGDTVAVKGDANITTTAGTNGIQVGLNKDLKVDSVKAGDTVVNNSGVNVGDKVVLGKDGLKAGDVNITAEGINAGGKKVTNVAAGTVAADSTDAVNGSQLYQANQAINQRVTNLGNYVVNMGDQINQRIDNVESDSKAGTAAAMAVAGLPQAYLPGKSMMAVAGGVYRGESGYAVGFSSISDGGNWVIKGTATGNSRGHYGATAGVGYQW
ncbi:ESPR-type extended signal peptide-containing protein [Morococcus cerebrosus]|uniref:Hep_Hag family protein n=3 Tax=Neisseriaceae TaxID=481 RepID=A0A0C1GKJ2_9NEIS|nr:ESPR-type extended signal peptide-containing protein [Morococcus cerebrosus]KIC05986.1 hep_Hag family protein [Morococcus cerebrosus]UNV87272.1 YadA-like family protein [Morococcus cerebrosus]